MGWPIVAVDGAVEREITPVVRGVVETERLPMASTFCPTWRSPLLPRGQGAGLAPGTLMRSTARRVIEDSPHVRRQSPAGRKAGPVLPWRRQLMVRGDDVALVVPGRKPRTRAPPRRSLVRRVPHLSRVVMLDHDGLALRKMPMVVCSSRSGDREMATTGRQLPPCQPELRPAPCWGARNRAEPQASLHGLDQNRRARY